MFDLDAMARNRRNHVCDSQPLAHLMTASVDELNRRARAGEGKRHKPKRAELVAAPRHATEGQVKSSGLRYLRSMSD